MPDFDAHNIDIEHVGDREVWTVNVDGLAASVTIEHDDYCMSPLDPREFDYCPRLALIDTGRAGHYADRMGASIIDSDDLADGDYEGDVEGWLVQTGQATHALSFDLPQSGQAAVIWWTPELAEGLGPEPDKYLRDCRDEFLAWCEGECYAVASDNEVAVCGLIGYEQAEAEATALLRWELSLAAKERDEAARWAARDVVTA
jgi:hypothetical protein